MEAILDFFRMIDPDAEFLRIMSTRRGPRVPDMHTPVWDNPSCRYFLQVLRQQITKQKNSVAPRRRLPLRLLKRQACQAEMPAALQRNSDVPWPVISAACQRQGAQLVDAGKKKSRS